MRKPFKLRLPVHSSDSVDLAVFGGGLAGLTAAYYAARQNLSVTVFSRSFQESASRYAKGGVAVPIAKGDTVSRHVQDTLSAGDGLTDEAMARFIVSQSIPLIHELLERGLAFDEVNGRLHLGKEGGHHFSRVLHMQGDQTGEGLTSFMLGQCRDSGVSLVSAELTDFFVHENRFCGAFVHSRDGFVFIRAKTGILASGGYASLYRNSTNPPSATGLPLAAAHRHGITLQDLEFVQFHPTTIPSPLSNFVVTESVRGEGAKIVNARGERFLKKYSPRQELATRDVISKAIYDEEFSGSRAFLDFSGFSKAYLRTRFPSFYSKAQEMHLNPFRQPIPITPSAHYCIGGIATDQQARTSLNGLFAAGEVACTGFHGANRLACNSLLECMVMGQTAGMNAARDAQKRMPGKARPKSGREEPSMKMSAAIHSLRGMLWHRSGILKSRRHLLFAIRFIESELSRVSLNESLPYYSALELAGLMNYSALKRKESRGVHRRLDFPFPRSTWRFHQTI
ncbi:MAG: FAD-dependent oxidoreductase [Candidatus Diapherotrites archaeon]|nr:FAD-dependent oxidoreductase [Candidatus Diapherotrites archaeon]